MVVKAAFDPRRITHHCNRSVSSFSLLKRGVITACGTNSRENSFSGRGASGMFWWTKDVLADDYLEKESCLSKTGYDLPLFFSGICHYLTRWLKTMGSFRGKQSPPCVASQGGARRGALGPCISRRLWRGTWTQVPTSTGKSMHMGYTWIAYTCQCCMKKGKCTIYWNGWLLRADW